jgi:N-acetylmuramoyl-L-alanine amidase
MRTITHIVLHCTATPQTSTIQSILDYWKRVLGWKNPGYHIIIPTSGRSQRLLPDEQVSNGVANHNAHSLHVSYVGGVDALGNPLDTRTPAQIAEQIRIIRRWLGEHPNAEVVGHRDFPGVKKACPSFDARAWWASVQ